MKKILARAFLWLMGWRPEGERPTVPQCVLIAAPHTSNWDLFYLLAFAEIYDLRISFLMKHSMFRGPFGPIARSLGGIAVRRDRRSNLVKQMAELFREHPRLVLVVPAEGTRSRVEYWKSGFYHLAREARVPIVPSFLDYARRRGGFGPAIVPSNDMRADMDKIRAFYAGKLGKHPECFGPVRLREEEPSADA